MAARRGHSRGPRCRPTRCRTEGARCRGIASRRYVPLHPRGGTAGRRWHLSAHARLQASAALVTGARRLRRIAALHGGGVRDKGQLMAERAFRRPHGLAHVDPLPDPETVRRAVEFGCTFLRRRQARTGAWKGFLLPPGAATSWLTAHVAFVVEDVPELTDACRRAALHLESTGA